MESVFNRANTPSFIAVTLATLTLLASGVFAIAPYVAFLSSIAAIGISLPVILILFALSTAVIALSYKIISQNKKLDVKEAEFNEKIKLATNTHQIKGLNMEELDKKLSSQHSEIVKLTDSSAKKFEEELSDKIANLREELNKLSSQHSEFVKLTDSSAKKDDVKELRKELSVAKEELKRLSSQIDSAAKKGETEEKLQMEFYKKGQEREEKTFSNIIFQDLEQKLREICESQKGQDALCVVNQELVRLRLLG